MAAACERGQLTGAGPFNVGLRDDFRRPYARLSFSYSVFAVQRQAIPKLSTIPSVA
jgi:hypothetical protein